MLVVRQSDKGAADAGFWENEAVNLLTLLIMGVVEMGEEARKFNFEASANLAEVQRLCCLPLLGNRPERDPNVPEYFEDTLKLLSSDTFSPVVRRQAGSFYGREPQAPVVLPLGNQLELRLLRRASRFCGGDRQK